MEDDSNWLFFDAWGGVQTEGNVRFPGDLQGVHNIMHFFTRAQRDDIFPGHWDYSRRRVDITIDRILDPLDR